MAATSITRLSTMQEVLQAYPSAQRALFRRYHIGGCHSCGYEPTDVLEVVANRHNIFDLDEVLTFIRSAEEIDRRMNVGPAEVKQALASATAPRLVDVRTPEEWEIAHIKGATLINQELAQAMMNWPKDTAIVFYCHHGKRSVDAAAYFAGHEFTNVRAMTGGIEAWAIEIDTSLARYEIVRDPHSGGPSLRPLRSAMS